MSEVPLKGGVACQPPASRSLHTLGPLGCECAQHRPTPRPSGERICRKALFSDHEGAKSLSRVSRGCLPPRTRPTTSGRDMSGRDIPPCPHRLSREPCLPYRLTSLARKCTPLGPYRRPTLYARGHGGVGGWAFSHGRGNHVQDPTLSCPDVTPPPPRRGGHTHTRLDIYG